MKSEGVRGDRAAAMERQTRFGKLPDRVRYEHLIEEKGATPERGPGGRGNPEGSWKYFSCLALDLGL
ncbi:hypothetical protein [Streptomyces sp. NPDC048565]|uniref:hypothetical protein n=1 Tax=Streptomyces sp. NPDC048565 TaxID=3155266 RepID=UPI003421958C